MKADQAAYLRRLSELLEVDISSFFPDAALNVSAPREFMALSLRINEMLESAAPRLGKHPRFKLHFTPTSASWLNLVKRFFVEITSKRIPRGSYSSVDELEP